MDSFEIDIAIMNLFIDTAAILNYIVSSSYYGVFRGYLHLNLLSEHPIISILINKIKNGRRIGKKVY